MSNPARVPSGVPTGGRYATSPKTETTLTLVPPAPPVPEQSHFEQPPAMPDKVALAAAWPNRYQRMDVLNAAYYDIASHRNSPGPERGAAARMAVRETFETSGRFVSLPEDDGEGEGYVFEALASDRKVEEALSRVGRLAEHEARSFGNRLAGALYDIETAEREERLAGAPGVEHPVAPRPPSVTDLDSSSTARLAGAEDTWPEWLPTEPPALDETW